MEAVSVEEVADAVLSMLRNQSSANFKFEI
jgi:hypothetical protein